MKRCTILFVILCASACALAQKADVAFTVGGSFVSDTKTTFLVPSTTLSSTIKTDHHIFYEGTLGVRLLDAKAASLHVELPVAGIPSQTLKFANLPSAGLNDFSTLFITPGLRLKLLPIAPISPWVSFGGGWARYSLSGSSNSKGAIQYGGGLDFKLAPVLGLRAEVRDFVTGDPNFGLVSVLNGNDSGFHHHNILAGGGIVLRF
jgi:hypothetical protein